MLSSLLILCYLLITSQIYGEMKLVLILFDFIWFDLIWFDLIWFDTWTVTGNLNLNLNKIMNHEQLYHIVACTLWLIMFSFILHRTIGCKRVGSISTAVGGSGTLWFWETGQHHLLHSKTRRTQQEGNGKLGMQEWVIEEDIWIRHIRGE